MQHVPLGRDTTVLELGCGDGFQLGLLRGRFARVFAIDPRHVPDGAGGCAYAFAEALPFGDSTFDLIVSNCVLEHLEDRRLGLDEAVRVLKPGGLMAHVVPSRYWKIASLFLNPLGYPMRVAEKWWAARELARHPQSSKPAIRGQAARPTLSQVLSRWLYPPIHGTYPTHFSELRAYGRRHWLKAFDHPQLARLSDAPLVCSTQFGFLRFRFTIARRWLGRHGLHSSRVFVLQKVKSC